MHVSETKSKSAARLHLLEDPERAVGERLVMSVG